MAHDRLGGGGGLIIANFAQAQYILGNGAASGIAMGGGNFTTPNMTTPTGLSLTGTGYNWGEWDIPVAQQVALNPADNKIIFTYTITGPTPSVAAGGTELGSGTACNRCLVIPVVAPTIRTGTLDMMATTSVTGFPMDRTLRTRMQGMYITRLTKQSLKPDLLLQHSRQLSRVGQR